MQEFVIAARGAEPAQVLRPECIDTVTSVSAAGHRLAVLSNELDLFYGSDFRRRMPLLNQFDVIIDATHTKILKPDPRAYQLVCDALEKPPSACVFVDDQARNIQGAREFGMQTVHFDVRDPAGSYRQAIACLGTHY
jgi:putative hydrolase of the HAD superfamily